MKKIRFFKILFIISVSLAPVFAIACAVLAIIFDQNTTAEVIPPEMAVVNFISYLCLVLAIMFLLVSVFFFGQMKRYQRRYYLAKAKENRDK